MNTRLLSKMTKQFLGMIPYFCIVLYCYPQVFAANITVYYPGHNTVINAQSTYLVGNVQGARKLLLNGQTIPLYNNKLFVKVINLKEGKNTFHLSAIGANKNKTDKVLAINVPYRQKPLPTNSLKIRPETLNMQGENIFKNGDLIHLTVQGSPHKKASLELGTIKIPMIEMTPETEINYAFGYKTIPSALKNPSVYSATYLIQGSERVPVVNPKVHLSDGKGNTKTFQLKNTTIEIKASKTPFFVAEVTRDDAVVRVGKSRSTPLPKGVMIAINGKQGDLYQFEMGKGKSGLIHKNDIKLLPQGTPPPQSLVKAVYTKASSQYVDITLPLTSKLPYEIWQDIHGKSLTLNLYGAIPDTDFVIYDPQDSLIKEILWKTPFDRHYQLNIYLNQESQWGYQVFYQNKTLVLRIKKKPQVSQTNPLKNLRVVIDAGHGGAEFGTVGPGGRKEKDINLAISKKLHSLLTEAGASVILTRTLDQNLGLYERPKIAEKYQADIFLSIHCNALPDGRDPLKEYGTSTFYYHSQALPLAQYIQEALVKELQSRNYGILYNNLVITRNFTCPSALIEVGFLINPTEYLKLTSTSYQNKAAVAIKKGIETFVSRSL